MDQPRRLEIRVLGPLEVARGGQPLPSSAWRTHKAPLLLALLAWRAPHLVPRDDLLEALWPEADDAADVGHALEVTVGRLRRALEPHLAAPSASTLVLTQSPGYRLAADAFLVDAAALTGDVESGLEAQRQGAFEPALEAFQRGLEVVRGEYLAGEDAAWLIAPRQHYRQLEARALRGLVESAEALGRSEDAAAAARRWLDQDPLNEAAARALMRALYLNGEQAATLQAFERLRRALAEDLGIDPQPETDALYQRILRGEVRPPERSAAEAWTEASRPGPSVASRQSAEGERAAAEPADMRTSAPRPSRRARAERAARESETPFVGRAPELRLLAEHLDDALAGSPTTLLLLGEPGAGKTRLAEQAISALSGRTPAVRVIEARAYSPAREVPYALTVALLEAALASAEPDELRAAVGPWSSALAILTPSIRDYVEADPVGAQVDRAQVQEAVAHFLVGLSSTAPLVLFLDDVQWADPSSLQTLHAVLRRAVAVDAPLALVATCRADESRDSPLLQEVLASLERDGLLVTCAVGPLGSAEVQVLLERASALAGVELQQATERLETASGGNPFYLVELLRALPSGDAAWQPDALPKGVRSVVERRLRALGEPSRRTLFTLAVLGRAVSIETLGHSSGQDEEQVVEAVERLAERLLVRLSGADVEFVHDLTRETALHLLLPPRRALLHRQVAAALEGRAPSGEVAVHAFEGQDWPRAYRAGAAALADALRAQAADEALGHAERARQALEAAGDTVAVPTAERGRLLLGRGQARDWLEQPEAEGDYLQALDLFRRATDPRGEAEALLALAELHGGRSDYRRALEEAEAAASVVSTSGDRYLEGLTLNRLGYLRANTARADQAEADHRRALEIFRSLGDTTQVADSLDLLATTILFRAGLEEARQLGEEALALFLTAGNWRRAASALSNVISGALWFGGRLGEARARMAEALALHRQHDNPRGEAECLSQDAFWCTDQGELGQARAQAEDAIRIADRIGHREWLIQGRTALAVALGALGWEEQARHVLAVTLGEARALGSTFWESWVLAERGRLEVGGTGHHQAALDLLEATAGDSGRLPMVEVWIFDALSESWLARGDPERATRYAEAALASATGARNLLPGANLRLARARLVAGDRDGARSLLDEAVALAEASGLVLVLVECLWARASLQTDEAAAEADRARARALVQAIADRLAGADRAQFLRHAPLTRLVAAS